VRHAIAAVPEARCWFARCQCTDSLGLPLVREAGFQPVLSQSIWYLHIATTRSWPRTDRAPIHYGRLPWERSRAPALLHLENAITPIQLHQLLERSSHDLCRLTMDGVLLDLAPQFGLGMEGNSWQLHCNQGEEQRQRWFTDLGLERQGDELLLALSIWRRQVAPMQNRWRHWLVDARQQLTPGCRPIPDLSQPTGGLMDINNRETSHGKCTT